MNFYTTAQYWELMDPIPVPFDMCVLFGLLDNPSKAQPKISLLTGVIVNGAVLRICC